MRAISGLWRWRRNPLRRRTDLAEAWLGLLALLLVMLAAPVVGLVATNLARDELREAVRSQLAARHEVTATVVRKLNRLPLDADSEAASAREVRSRVMADWTAPDGSAHRAVVPAVLKNPAPGDTFTMWTDRQGNPVARPLDEATAETHAVLAGVGAGLLTAGLVEGVRRLSLWWMVRRRYLRWERAWERVGPDWGRAGAGS